VTTRFTVTLLQAVVADLRRLEDVTIERERASEVTDWAAPQQALDAIREGTRLLSWPPYSCRRAELGNGRSRELIVPFGGTGHIALSRLSATRSLWAQFANSGKKTTGIEATLREPASTCADARRPMTLVAYRP
jgi:hypothetical protein